MNTSQILHALIIALSIFGTYNWIRWTKHYKRGFWLVLPVISYFINTFLFHASTSLGFPYLTVHQQNIWSFVIRIHSVTILAFMPYILLNGLTSAMIAKVGEKK